MPTINLGRVKGDTGTSMRNRGVWAASTAYVNNSQYMDVVTNGGNSYVCKTSHTSGSSFSATNWTMIAQKGATGATGATPTIKAGTATSLDATAAPTVSATTSGSTTTFNFGIPKGDTSDIKTPTFTDTVSTYFTLTAANNAAETASSAIKSKVSIFTILSNMKKSFSAIVQGLKILGTNVGAITGITSDLAGESETVAASIKAVNQLNSKLVTVESVTLIKKANSNYEIDGTNYPFIYKNGFLVGSLYVTCKSPFASYTIVANLPDGFNIHGATFYWQEDEVSGNADVPRIFLHASNNVIGVRGGQANKAYMGLISLPCVKN